MTADVFRWPRKQELVVYFLLAYALSWVVQIPLALQAEGLVQWQIPFSSHYLAAFGPLLSAFITTWLSSGWAGLRELIGRMLKWRVRPIWWVVAFLPLFGYIVLAVAFRSTQAQWLRFTPLGQVDFLPNLGLGALLLWIMTFGIGEETGWRGFALPRLQSGRSALSATIILWVFWALWHLPAFFYLYNPAIAVGFLFGILAGAVTFTWLYNGSRGSILIVAVWHGVFNFTTGCTECKTGMVSTILSTLVIVWAVLVVILFKPANLSKAEKQVV